MEKLTAIIPTGNEEHNIEAVLQSVSFADEIMVVDSFSTDRTVELARKHTDFIIQREYGNPASQQNWAIPQANNEWILLVDADERVTPELAAEIKNILKKGTEMAAFLIYRQNYYMDKKIRFSGWQSDRTIRLFRKSVSRYEDKYVHAEVIVEGKVGRLRNKLQHYTYKDLGHWLRKSDRYTSWGAYDRLHKTQNVGFFHLFIKPAYAFFNRYFLKLGILDVKAGLILATLSSYCIFLRSLKIWRIKQGEKFEK